MAGFVVWGRVATPMAVTELEREIRVGDTATMHESSCSCVLVSMMTRNDPHKIGLYKLVKNTSHPFGWDAVRLYDRLLDQGHDHAKSLACAQ